MKRKEKGRNAITQKGKGIHEKDNGCERKKTREERRQWFRK